MSIKITGDDNKTVKKLQSRLDKFISCSKAHEEALRKLNECAAEQIELAHLPAHEDRYQTLLAQYKSAVDALKARAEKTARKTNEKHIDKYFKKRHNSWIGTNRYYINPDHFDYVKGIHQEAQQILALDFGTHITQLQDVSQRKKTEAQTTIEYSLIDQTFPSRSDQLLKENPGEYLRQASLYQQRLLEKKDETAVLAFGNAWIKNLPKDATWDQVENMSLIMLEAAKTQENADLNGYRVAVEEWLKEHSLPQTPDSVDPTQATTPWGRRTYLLGKLYVHQRDLSPEAFQVYQRCGSLYPDQHGWKILQAHYHISRLEWLEAEQALAGLPPDDVSVRDVQRYLKVTKAQHHISRLEWLEAEQALAGLPPDDASVRATQRSLKVTKAQHHIFHRQWLEAGQALAGLSPDDASVRETQRTLIEHQRERIGSAVLDLGMNIIPRIIPDQYKETATFDIGQTFLHVSTSGLFRKRWLPFVLRTSGEMIPLDISVRSIATVIGDIVDCVFRQKASLRCYQRSEAFISCGLRAAHTTWTLVSSPADRSLPSAASFLSLLISLQQASDSYREIRRPPVLHASLSTIQQIASDFALGALIASYSDLLPLIVGEQAKSLTARVSSFSRQETEETSKDKWVAAALAIGSLTVYRLYCDYPCLWAASVMREVELYFSQGKYDDAERVLSDAENTYFVSSARPVVRNYARYLIWLKDNPRFLEDPNASVEFFMQIDLALNTMKKSSYFRALRNTLLMKKLEIAMTKLDPERVAEVLNEKPENKIITDGFHLLLNKTFSIALQDPAAACSFLQTMKSSFSPSYHPIVDEYLRLLQTHSESLPKLSQLSLQAELQQSSEEITQWNTALQELQDFFSKNEEDKVIYQHLQYYKLMLAFVQTNNTEETETLFKESDPELHRWFSHGIVQCTRQLWGVRRHQEAIDLLKRVNFGSFDENALMQNYEHFFSLLCSLPSVLGMSELSLDTSQQGAPDPVQFSKETDTCKRYTKKQIAQLLWLSPEIVITDDTLENVNAVSIYLYKNGYMLKGVKADGNCFCNAFLGSYRTLSRKIPLLDSADNQVSFLRDQIASKVQQKNIDRADEIKTDANWITAAEEGELLAIALSIPIRIITVQKGEEGCGISDVLTFTQAAKPPQSWETIDEEDKPEEYILIIDLGGHFIYANTLVQNNVESAPIISSTKVTDESQTRRSLPLEGLPPVMEKLERCIADLDPSDIFHRELRVFFKACRVVLNLYAGEHVTARNHLAPETTDLGVSDEVAALLFERIYTSMEERGVKNALTNLQVVIEALGSWQHQELFRAFQAYLMRDPSQAQFEHLASVITCLAPIKQLSIFAFKLQFLQFELWLSQENFAAAQKLLKSKISRELYSALCNTLFIFFIHRGQQLRQINHPLRKIRENLQGLKTIFDIPNIDMIESYIEFLVHLENAEEEREITAYEEASQSLNSVFGNLDSIQSPIPVFLKEEKVMILVQIAILAKKARQWQTALMALEEVQKIDENIEHIDSDIFELKGLLKASTK